MVKFQFYVVPPLVNLSVKYLSSGQKLPIKTALHNFLEIRHPELTKNPYYVFPTRGAIKGISTWIMGHVYRPFKSLLYGRSYNTTSKAQIIWYMR